MLTTIEQVQALPGFTNTAAIPTAWLNQLIGGADVAVKRYCKRDLELTNYTQFYNGSEQRDIMVRQYPLWSSTTTVAAGSNGVSLPVATLNVASTAGFPPGTGGNPLAQPPAITVQSGTSPNSYSVLTYTGTTATTFTGCSGGTGTLATGFTVGTPSVYFDPQGYFGQSPNGFASGTLVIQGTQWVTYLDEDAYKSQRGLIRRIGGNGGAWVGFYPSTWGMPGKLSAYRQPCWPRGDGNIKVLYSAGFAPTAIPLDLSYATAMLVANMVRIQPSGTPLQSESLGAYSYTVLTGSPIENPELGTIQRTLAPYREISWGYP